MRTLPILFFKILLTLSIPVYSYVPEEGQVTFGALINTYRTQFSGGPTLKSSSLMGGFGLIVTGDLNSSNSIEVSISHLNKIFYRSQDTRFLAERTRLVQVNVGYRKWMLSWANIGLALSSGYPFGDYEVVHSDGGLDNEIGTTAREISHYAGEISTQFEIHKTDKGFWTADIYWSQSFSAKSEEKAHHAGLVLTYKELVRDNKSESQQGPQPADDDFVN